MAILFGGHGNIKFQKKEFFFFNNISKPLR